VGLLLSIDINVTEEHLKSGTLDINPDSGTLYKRMGLSREKKKDKWEL
jgi:hypothetical protein